MSSKPFTAPIVWSEAAHNTGALLQDDSATRAAGAQLANALAPILAGDSAAVLITLQGDLGAGKTTFTQGFLKALGVQGRVRSPTFTLVETYRFTLGDSPDLTANHFDCYRFSGAEEWFESGFDELIARASVSLVEWPQNAGQCLPPADIALTLQLAPQAPQLDLPDQRRLLAQAHSARGRLCLEQLAASHPIE